MAIFILTDGGPISDQCARIFHLEIPLRDPFVTAGMTVTRRSVALVRIGEDPFGWGEAAPFPGQDEPFDDVMQAASDGQRTPTLHAALDEAAADLDARIRGVALSDGLGESSEVIPVSLAIGMSNPVESVERAVDGGVTRFKIKIAPGRVDHVAAIRRRFSDVSLGVDANGSFDATTIDQLRSLTGLGIAYLEQPVPDLNGEAARSIHAVLGAPVIADESVRSVADAEALLDLGHIDGVVAKPGRLGWSGALAVRLLANARGKLWRASGLLETGIGRAFTDTLAAGADGFLPDVAPAGWFLESDIAPLRYGDAGVTLPTGLGVGVEAIPEMLDRYLVESFDLTDQRS